MRNGERGVTLFQVLLILAVVALAVGASLPSMSRALRTTRIRRATWEMASTMRLERHRAIAESRSRGLVFAPVGDDWTYTVHVDGDGDGIRTSDLRGGTDRRHSGPHRLSARHPTVRPGYLPLRRLPRIPPASGFLTDLRDPVKFGPADIISFSPTGRSSSGTLYLTDGQDQQWAVVLYGVTGRMRIWRYDTANERWTR